MISEVNRRGMYVLAVTTTPKAFEGNLRLVGEGSRIRVAVGLHPELAAERQAEVGLLCASLARTRYVGEIGMDGSPDHRASLDVQRRVLRTILTACRQQGGKIISIHSRLAVGPVLDELDAAGNVGTPVLHWFSGSPDDLRRATGAGCWFSVGPAMLASRNGRRLAELMPQARVLPETDGPFGQVRGKPLNPWDSALVIPELGRLWGASQANVAETLSTNLRRLVS